MRAQRKRTDALMERVCKQDVSCRACGRRANDAKIPMRNKVAAKIPIHIKDAAKIPIHNKVAAKIPKTENKKKENGEVWCVAANWQSKMCKAANWQSKMCKAKCGHR